MITTYSSGHTIETWYDRKSRNWITQLFDKNQYQIDDAIYTGNKICANIAHKEMIVKANKLIENK